MIRSRAEALVTWSRALLTITEIRRLGRRQTVLSRSAGRPFRSRTSNTIRVTALVTAIAMAATTRPATSGGESDSRVQELGVEMRRDQDQTQE